MPLANGQRMDGNSLQNLPKKLANPVQDGEGDSHHKHRQSNGTAKMHIRFDEVSENSKPMPSTANDVKPKNNKNDLKANSQNLLQFRRNLPIYSAKERITARIKANPTVIIVGETGSGKTTQIPQFLVESGIASREKGAVAITQPRRVAAISLAKRVSEEYGTLCGQKVGYSVRFDDTSSPGTIIKYLTDGMLLRELLSDPMLSRYSVVILDEAHERTLRTDILFGMVKMIQKQRREMLKESNEGPGELKIVVMSATLDAEKFSEYFDKAEILYVSGRLHQIKIFHTTKPQTDYVDSALVTVFQIHLESPPGDVLVFLTGQDEIESLEKLLKEYSKQLPPGTMQLLACPIFAALPTAQQQRVFDITPPNARKVILATNIAETSITIPGIRFVIDSGVAKQRGYNSRIGIESLLIQPISKSSARQRSGRAGREAPGYCYRLYSEEIFDELDEDSIPEIKRCNLASAVLTLMASGVRDVLGFDYMDRPSRSSLQRALEELYALGSLNDKGELTDLGIQMAKFPLEPTYAKVLIQSQHFNCTSEIIAIISLLSVDQIFFTPQEKYEQAIESRKKFGHRDGDHLMLLNVLKAWQEVKGDKEWANENFVNTRNMKHILDIQKQLTQFCTRMNINPNLTCGTDTDIVLKCFLSGFFRNTALLQPDGTYKTVIGGQVVNIHPSSSIVGKKFEAIMYNELIFTTKTYARSVSAILSAWLPNSAPRYFDNIKPQS